LACTGNDLEGRERQNGYERPPWSDLRKQWNEKHPGKRFEKYRDFRKYCMRGAKAVINLNFNWPQPDEKDPLDEMFDALKKALHDHPQLREMSAWEVLRKMPAEEVARQLVQGGYLEEEPSPSLVEDMLRSIDAEEQAVEVDEA
jgi:hypothetical protein